MVGLNSKNVSIAKTIKLYINGQFPRTESGRSFAVKYKDSDEIYAHLCQASRKDVRMTVEVAKNAQAGWQSRDAYNRGQILYRMAEMMEGKVSEFVDTIVATQGMTADAACKETQDAIKALVYYAGFTDKYEAIMGSINPVSGPITNFTKVDPMGVVAIIGGDSLAKTVADISAVIATGNTAVVLMSETTAPNLAALAEVFATSDLPAGVVNLLSGFYDELWSHFASHMEINALSFQDSKIKNLGDIKAAAVDNLKRMITPKDDVLSLDYLTQFVEYKTVWQTSGY